MWGFKSSGYVVDRPIHQRSLCLALLELRVKVLYLLIQRKDNIL